MSIVGKTIMAAKSVATTLVASFNSDPMAIITGDTNMENPATSGTVAYVLDFPGLIYTLQRALILVGIIGILASGAAMYFVNDSKMRAEKKQEIMKKLMVVLLASSVLTLFDILKRILDFLN